MSEYAISLRKVKTVLSKACKSLGKKGCIPEKSFFNALQKN